MGSWAQYACYIYTSRLMARLGEDASEGCSAKFDMQMGFSGILHPEVDCIR